MSSLAPTERELSRAVRKALELHGCAVYSTEQGYRKERGGTRTSPGIPDLIVFGEGKWTFAELKTAKGRLTKSQAAFARLAGEAGAPCCVWRSVGEAVEWARDG